MTALLRHARLRALATVRDPWALAVVLGTGLMSLAMWPAAMRASGPAFIFVGGGEVAPGATLLVFLWIWLWPALAGPLIGGRSAVTGVGSSMSLQPNPALPIGARDRVVAETALLFAVVLAMRVPILFMGNWIHATLALPGAHHGAAVWMVSWAGASLMGSVLMLPSAVAWVTPSRDPRSLFVRSGFVIGIEMVAMHAGLLRTPALATVTCGVLVVVQLLLIGREWRVVRLPWCTIARRRSLSRSARPPLRQLVRDFTLRPMPLALSLLALQLSLLTASATVLPKVRLLGSDGPGLLYLGSSLMLGVAVGVLALRPMGSAQAMAGVVGKTGHRPGDFAAAWAALPVQREWVLRAVYLHGMLATGAIWVMAILTAIASSWVDKGSFDASQFFGGSPGELLVPMLAVVPCVAGMLTSGAAGRTRKTVVAGLAMIAVFHGHFLLLMLQAPVVIHAAFLLLAAAMGGGPALTELRRPRPVAATELR